MGYGSIAYREVGRTPIYDDEFSFDHRGGFGSLWTQVINKIAQPTLPVLKAAPAPTAPVVSPGSTTIGIAPIPLPPPITDRGGQLPKPVSAQTTVGPPVSPTVGQTPPTVTTGTDGGTTVAVQPTDGGFGKLVGQAKNPLVIGGLLVLGLLALRRSGGTRRY